MYYEFTGKPVLSKLIYRACVCLYEFVFASVCLCAVGGRRGLDSWFLIGPARHSEDIELLCLV